MIRVALLCLVCVLLSACGGGGDGGGGGTGGIGGTGGSNQPPPPSFALTEANAVQATAYALAPLEQLLPAASLAMNGAASLRIYGGP
jgi:hypothetical protein